MRRSSKGLVRAALAKLPENCRYHGADIVDQRGFPWYSGACCETGERSLLRRRAIETLDAEPDDEQVTVTETFGWRRDDFDPHRSPGWDGVNAPGMGTATREWAEARAEEDSRRTGTGAHVVRREIRVTQWRRDDGR